MASGLFDDDVIWSIAGMSECQRYRYTLLRRLDRGDTKLVFIGLNPSTADAHHDDPTIRRCIGYARAWGMSSMWMLNLFAFRATDPADMRAAPDPIGPENDATIDCICQDATMIVAAWGVHGTYLGRDNVVRDRLKGRLHALRLTRGGHPAHPLYLPAELKPQPWM